MCLDSFGKTQVLCLLCHLFISTCKMESEPDLRRGHWSAAYRKILIYIINNQEKKTGKKKVEIVQIEWISLLCFAHLRHINNQEFKKTENKSWDRWDQVRASVSYVFLIYIINNNQDKKTGRKSWDRWDHVDLFLSHVMVLSLMQDGRETLMSRHALIRLKRTNLLSF